MKRAVALRLFAAALSFCVVMVLAQGPAGAEPCPGGAVAMTTVAPDATTVDRPAPAADRLLAALTDGAAERGMSGPDWKQVVCSNACRSSCNAAFRSCRGNRAACQQQRSACLRGCGC